MFFKQKSNSFNVFGSNQCPNCKQAANDRALFNVITAGFRQFCVALKGNEGIYKLLDADQRLLVDNMCDEEERLLELNGGFKCANTAKKY